MTKYTKRKKQLKMRILRAEAYLAKLEKFKGLLKSGSVGELPSNSFPKGLDVEAAVASYTDKLSGLRGLLAEHLATGGSN